MGVVDRVRLRERCHSDSRFDEFIGNSPALESALAEVERVGPTDSTVLILGETGTGKELIARAIHSISARKHRPFVKLNCSAIPFNLLENELFGHEKGAFTGAVAQKIGRFEMADTGTLFMDEIGDLSLALQPKLLRVLQEQEFERLGGGQTHQIDVRLIAATHRDLTEMVAREEFRTDLYYRLNVFPVVLPPLRERREDIPQLAWHFVEVFSRRMGKKIDRIPEDILDGFMSYSWPGNVRELRNLIERAVIRSDNGLLSNPLSKTCKYSATATPLPEAFKITPSQRTFGDFTRGLILHTLETTGWVVGGPRGAVSLLGLKRTTLIAKMKKLGISRRAPQNDSEKRNGEERPAGA